jgi:hypothetical protein
MAIDPRTRYPRPPFKSQQQDNPGSSARMQPEPSYGEDSYRGSGKLEGRVALAVWSRSEVTGIELEDVRGGVPGVAYGFEGRLPPECLEVLGKVVG